MRLQDKVAIVTGGAAGIGRAICELFFEEGARVVIADIDSDGGNETAGLIADAGGDAVFVETDVSDEAQVANLVDAAVERYGGVNVLVNDAAAFVFGKVEDVTPAQWERVIGVNVLGPAYTVKHSLSHLRAAGGGSIVNIASISSFVAQSAFVPYNTSKGALLQLTRCLALDLAPDNIRVNCVCPGAILTQATELHRRCHRRRSRSVSSRRRQLQLPEASRSSERDSLRRSFPCVGRVFVHDGSAADNRRRGNRAVGRNQRVDARAT